MLMLLQNKLQNQMQQIWMLFAETWQDDPQFTVKEELSQQVAVIGENLNIRRFERYTRENAGKLVSYIHGGGRIGVMIELACEKK